MISQLAGDVVMNSERYKFLRRLASGGVGDVYLVYDQSLRREAVIKTIRGGSIAENQSALVIEEAAKMAAIKHPNIVSIYDVFVQEGQPFIVMEYVQGLSLEERTASRGPLSVSEFVDITRQILDAMAAAHQAGLLHRDIKPSNIMVQELPSGSMQAKVLDFGLAKFYDALNPSPQTVNIDGSVQGSIHYISPEQLNNEPVDARSDLYSLGCTLYYCLSGREPFTGDNVGQIVTAHLTHRVEPLTKFRPDLPPWIASWLEMLIAREPADRFYSVMQALQTFNEAVRADKIITDSTPIYVDRRTALVGVARHPTQAVPVADIPVAPRGGMHPALFGLTLLLLLAVLAGGAAWWYFNPSRTTSSAEDPPAEAPAPVPTAPAPPPAVEPPATAQIAPPLPPEEPASQPPPAQTAPALPPQTVHATEGPVAASKPVEETPAAPEVVENFVMRVRGSNTLGSRMVPALLRGYLQKIGATEISDYFTAPEERVISFRPPGGGPREAFEVHSHGSSTSFQNLLARACDLGISSRPIKPKEVEELAFLGNMLSPACEHVVALDGLAVIVNSANPVSSLSVQQISKIFAGEILDWAEVGGTPGPIHLYARDDKSGTYDSFKTMVLGDRSLRSDAERFEDSNMLSDKVSADPRGIGFIGLPYIRGAKPLAVFDDGTRPLLPSPFTVASEDYVLSRRLFFYSPAVSENPYLTHFIEFTQSDEGQEIVNQVGFVSQKAQLESVKLPDHLRTVVAPEIFEELNQASGRLSLVFRFLPGSSALDSKGVRDLERMARFLARPENRGKSVVLVGHSDSTGSPSANLALSSERAAQIRGELELRGIQVKDAVGLGSHLPVASNESKAGREKNRRVEVWLTE